MPEFIGKCAEWHSDDPESSQTPRIIKILEWDDKFKQFKVLEIDGHWDHHSNKSYYIRITSYSYQSLSNGWSWTSMKKFTAIKAAALKVLNDPKRYKGITERIPE